MTQREPDQRWFEIADDGWRRLSASRPLGRLLLEALQNAFDERAARVSVSLSMDEIVVEDDADLGIVDERLVYTIFLSDKPDDPTRRGRMGRGLKELIAGMDSAIVETVGTTVEFGETGRRSRANDRARGTRLTLRRAFEGESSRRPRRCSAPASLRPARACGWTAGRCAARARCWC
ncbi:MAG: hypothetical protein M5U28_43280 [Sandaracinaceae bacterium]|nr:hypothetical protein [Sandaracinaceae bacterium]